MKKIRIILLSILVLSLVLAAGFMLTANHSRDDFQYWNPGAEALTALQEYVADVTDVGSANFIPEEDRIAVFDMDGTLYCEKSPTYLEWWMFVYRVLEDPTYEAPEEIVEIANDVAEAVRNGVIPEDLEARQSAANAKVYENMTLGEFRDYVDAYLLKEAEGFTGMSYAEAWYLPMLEVVDYLNRNKFTVYICSGSDRFLCRTVAEGMVDIPERQIIGMDVLCVASGQGDTNGMNYVYTANDDVVRTGQLIVKNVKANKVSQIVQEIGTKPVLCFGNSTGDMSMAIYTTSRNPYRSMAFMVVADDSEREYGDAVKSEELREKWDSFGWVSISMKEDWSTIYGDDVTRAAP